jgi:hypothetical protein
MVSPVHESKERSEQSLWTPGLKKYLRLMLVVGLLGMFIGSIYGCASIEERTGGSLYLDIEAFHQLDGSSDWYVRTERTWQCDINVGAAAELGLSWDEWEAYYRHQSWWFCGRPFNPEKPELYQDSVGVRKRFWLGGRR